MKICLLCGGRSSERAVSFASAESVMQNISETHEIVLLDFGRNEVFNDFNHQKQQHHTPKSLDSLIHFLEIIKTHHFDIILIMLHGGDGEDGHIQALFDMADISYSGCSYETSLLCMNKTIFKIIMQYYHIPTPAWCEISDLSFIDSSLTFPCILKPVSEGSTVGFYMIHSHSDLLTALSKSLPVYGKMLLEAYIPGRELTITVYNGSAYPVVEISPDSGCYDYESKYTKGKTRYICPADISSELTDSISSDAVSLYKHLHMTGVVRFDVRLDGQQYYFLEANTLPGMTELSLVPMSFKAKGFSYAELIEKIIRNS